VTPGSAFRVVFSGDLRVHLRDPVTILMMVVLPVLLFPAVIFGGQALQSQQQGRLETEVLAVSVPDAALRYIDDSDALRVTRGALSNDAPDEVDQLQASLSEPIDGVVTLSYRGTGARSKQARNRLRSVFERWRDGDQAHRFEAAGRPVTPGEVLAVQIEDLATAGDRAGQSLGRYLPLVLVFLVMGGGTYTALDLFTGERERGTLETLLTTSADRRGILLAKYGLVVLFCFATGLCALASFAVTARLGIADVEQAVDLSPTALGVMAVLLVPLALQLAALLVATASYAPDFKTGQNMALPVLLVAAAPAAVAAAPTIELSYALALVPIANVAVASRAALGGTVEAGPLLVCLVATGVHAGIALAGASRLMGREQVVLGSASAGDRRARGNYAGDALWTFLCALLALWFLGQTAQHLHLARGMAFTQLALMAGPALLAPMALGLPIRPLLSLRRPAWSDVALALIAGVTAPCIGQLVAAAQDPLLPTPTRFLEAMEDAILLDLPLPALLLLFAVLPAICEELLFRGTIQGLLRSRLAPLARVLVVGLLFGLVHLSLTRILPTGVLGILFAVAVLRSRSLGTAMLMHGLNNGLLIAAGHSGALDDVDVPLLVLLAGGAVCVGAVAAMGRLPRAPRRG